MRSLPIDPADLSACSAALRKGSSSFHMAGRLLPRRVREHASAIYAFCRMADDAVDIGQRRDSLTDLQRRLDLSFAGRPRANPVDRAFAAVVHHHQIPRALPEALLEGLAWDIEGRRYRSLADVEAYSVRVAGSVGAMMAIVMGTREEEALARACDLGVAMQLTNIARDVGEDARMGRIYLPTDWLQAEGVEPDAWLESPAHTDSIARVTERLLDAAETLYARSVPGIGLLPALCRPGIHAARLIYADIGERIAANGFNSVDTRAYVPASRKLALVARAVPSSALGRRAAGGAPLQAARYLVDATARPLPRPAAAPAPMTARVVWLLDLFERLERQKQA